MAPGAQNVYGDPTVLQQNTWGIDNKTHEIKQTARKTSLHRSYTEVRSQQEAARRKGDWKTKMYFETAHVETSWVRNAREADRQATSRSFHKRNVEKTTRMNDGNEI